MKLRIELTNQEKPIILNGAYDADISMDIYYKDIYWMFYHDDGGKQLYYNKILRIDVVGVDWKKSAMIDQTFMRKIKRHIDVLNGVMEHEIKTNII